MPYLDDEISRLMQKCISCGKCTIQCPSAKYGGCDPHEVMMIGEGDIANCIMCGTCSRVCRRTDPLAVIKGLIYLERGGEFSDDFERTGYGHPIEDCPSRTELDPKWDGGGVNIMPGCIVKAKVPYLEYASAVAIRSLGYTCKELDGSGCCMRPAQFSDIMDIDKRAYKAKMVGNASGADIVSLCPGCSEEMSASALDVMNMIQFLHRSMDMLPKLDRPFPVAIEPGCQAADLKDEMREIVEAIGCKVINSRIGCCGKDTSVSVKLMEERMKECSGCGAIVTACPKCFTKYDSQSGGKPVLYISELVAIAVGDFGSLSYHKIPVNLDDPLLYDPVDKVLTLGHEDKTRW